MTFETGSLITGVRYLIAEVCGEDVRAHLRIDLSDGGKRVACAGALERAVTKERDISALRAVCGHV